MESEKTYHMLYKTTCTVTGNFYIGVHSTENLEDEYFGSGKRLRYSIQKYGKEKHVREILQLFESRDEMYFREREVVNDEMLDNPHCLNLHKGGDGGWTSEEQRRNGNRGNEKMKWLAENDSEWREKKSKAASDSLKEAYQRGRKVVVPNWKGKSLSENHRQNIGIANSLSQKGAKNSQAGKIWITKEDKSISIKSEELSVYLQLGWRKGRKRTW